MDSFRVDVGVGVSDDWKRERNERARREYLRKITDPAENRMRTRTARQQLSDAMDALKGPGDIPLPDADDESTTRSGVLL